jgi:lysophospholipase L1-like esterase
MGRLKAAAAIVAVTLALDVGLAQIAKRIVPQWHAIMPASNPRMASPIYHHGLRPMMDTKVRAGPTVYRFATNSLGMVDEKPRRIDPRADACRYLVIGGSFTEGYGVGWRESFAGILARRWRINGVDVLNAGVVGYSPTIYYRRIRHLIEDVGLRFGAVLVLIDIGDPSKEWRSYDLDGGGNVTSIGQVWQINPMRDPNWRDYLRFWIQDNSLIARLAKELYGKLRKRPQQAPGAAAPPPLPHRPPVSPPLGAIEVPRPPDDPPAIPPGHAGTLGVDNARWTVDADAWNAWGRDGLRVSAERMDRLLLLLRAHGIGLTIAVYPWPDQIFAGDADSVQVRYWREWARTRGVDLVDLFPPFFRGDDPLETIRRYFAVGGFHWNAAGHALIAERIDQAVEPRRACR